LVLLRLSLLVLLPLSDLLFLLVGLVLYLWLSLLFYVGLLLGLLSCRDLACCWVFAGGSCFQKSRNLIFLPEAQFPDWRMSHPERK
jgi:hypothetical protein